MVKKYILVVVLVLLSARVLVDYFAMQSLSEDFKNEINKLDSLSNQLNNQQKAYDSLLKSEQTKLQEIEGKLQQVKENEAKLNKKFNDLRDKVGKYTPTQVDSFFRQRYKY